MSQPASNVSLPLVQHPVQQWPFDVLEESLRTAVSAGLVRAVKCQRDPNVVLYCYSQRTVVERAWNDITTMARGLVLDHASKTVLARPFPKFFNFGEMSASVPDEPFEAFEKLDGSLAIVFFEPRRGAWRVATKGSLTSPQAEQAQRFLDRLDTTLLERGTTYLFEVIYAANRIVVSYDFEGLVLLGAYDGDGRELSRDELVACASSLGTRVAATLSYETIDAMVAACEGFARDTEGFVVRFASGLRLKLKGAEYLRVHRLIARVTPLMLWECLRNQQPLDAVRRELPEEFWRDFDTIRQLLTQRYEAMIAAVHAEVAKWQDKTDKELGLRLGEVSAQARPFVFLARRKGAGWQHDPKAHDALWRELRPTGNELAGYVPSTTLRAVQEDA